MLQVSPWKVDNCCFFVLSNLKNVSVLGVLNFTDQSPILPATLSTRRSIERDFLKNYCRDSSYVILTRASDATYLVEQVGSHHDGRQKEVDAVHVVRFKPHVHSSLSSIP